MSNPYFRFKQFTIRHDRCAMKVGTDGVLLGAWAPVADARRILDVGTGTGLVALMLAQRSRAMITAIEIDGDAVWQARGNVVDSPWPDRVEVVHADFRSYRPGGTFDAIVSNPPYFSGSLHCPDGRRTSARHDDSLAYGELLEGVAALLSDTGCFTLILPAGEGDRVKELARSFSLFPVGQLNVRTTPGGGFKRSLIAFARVEGECCVEELLTEVERHRYSDGYLALTKDFYL